MHLSGKHTITGVLHYEKQNTQWSQKRVRLAGSKKRLRIKVRAVNRAHILTKESAKKRSLLVEELKRSMRTTEMRF